MECLMCGRSGEIELTDSCFFDPECALRIHAHAAQVESERQRLEKAEELLQGARDYINAPEGLDAAVKIVRNIDAFLNHASNTPRGG